MKIFQIAAILLLMNGCASAEYITRTNQKVGSFNGQNIQVVANQIGYWTRVFDSPKGKVYAWEISRSMVSPQVIQTVQYSNTAQSYGMGGIPIVSSCNVYFTTDKNDIIIDWQWQGNGC